MSFYVTKTVLVGPKWFWSDQIDLDLTIMIWSQPKWNGHHQNELVRSKLWFMLVENHNLVLTNSFWSWPNHYGQVQINLVRPKPFWTDQICHIERQGINHLCKIFISCIYSPLHKCSPKTTIYYINDNFNTCVGTMNNFWYN